MNRVSRVLVALLTLLALAAISNRAMAEDEPRPTARTRTVRAHFARPGETCLDSAGAVRVLQALIEHARAGATVEVDGSSDAVELHDAWNGASSCVRPENQASLVERGHERLAKLRALAVWQLGHDAGLPGFERSAAADRGAVALVRGSRMADEGIEQRRVEVRFTYPPTSDDPAPTPTVTVVLPPTEPAPAASTEPPPENAIGAMPPSSADWTLITGVTATGLGCGAAAAGGVLLGVAAGQRAQGSELLDDVQAQSLERDAEVNMRAGIVSAGVGLGLIAGGVILWAIHDAEPGAKDVLRFEPSRGWFVAF